jgi:hypothetical protein
MGDLAALSLVILFIAAIPVALARGRECECQWANKINPEVIGLDKPDRSTVTFASGRTLFLIEGSLVLNRMGVQ